MRRIHLSRATLVLFGLCAPLWTICGAPGNVTRSVEYRQVSNFATDYSIVSMKMCADGTRVVFGTGGPQVKVFTINTSGSGLQQVADFQRTGTGPFVDISADGERVIWCDQVGDGAIYAANADGSGMVKIVSLLPHPDPVFAPMTPSVPVAPRITADGTRIYFIHNHRDPRGTGVWRVDADGSNLVQVFNYVTMAQGAFGRDVSQMENFSLGHGFDISGDGGRMIVGTVNFKLEVGDYNRGDAVFVQGGSFYPVGEYAVGHQPFATYEDGDRVILFQREFNAALGADEINVAFVPLGTGDPVKVVTGLDIFGTSTMAQLAGDGSRGIVAAANGRLPITLVDRASASRLDLVSIDGVSLAIGAFRFSLSFLPSINANGDSFCFLAPSNPPQIWVGRINSNAITSLPAITLVEFEPAFSVRDGSTTATIRAHVSSPPHAIHAVAFEAFKDGVLQFRAVKSDWPYGGHLVDNGEFGDTQAGDGWFCNNSVRVDLPETPAGTYAIRLAAVNTTLREITMAEAEPFFIAAVPVGNSPVIMAQPLSSTVTAGARATLSVGAIAAGEVSYQWQFEGTDIAGATADHYDLPYAQAFQAGTYRVVVTSQGNSVTSDTVTLTVSPPASSTARLLNLSNRSLVGSGDEIMIPGFVVSDGTNKTILVRAVGPGLAQFGVTGYLADPRLTVFRESTALFTNDDWQSSPGAALTQQTADQVGAFALEAGSKDAAFVVTVPPGAYTVQVTGADGGTGIALVELYEVP